MCALLYRSNKNERYLYLSFFKMLNAHTWEMWTITISRFLIYPCSEWIIHPLAYLIKIIISNSYVIIIRRGLKKEKKKKKSFTIALIRFDYLFRSRDNLVEIREVLTRRKKERKNKKKKEIVDIKSSKRDPLLLLSEIILKNAWATRYIYKSKKHLRGKVRSKDWIRSVIFWNVNRLNRKCPTNSPFEETSLNPCWMRFKRRSQFITLSNGALKHERNTRKFAQVAQHVKRV